MGNIKISDSEIEITKPEIVETAKVTRYKRKFIKEQLASIKADKKAYVALRDAEIAECQAILNAMTELGITNETDATPII
jgi:hypothetical protein